MDQQELGHQQKMTDDRLLRVNLERERITQQGIQHELVTLPAIADVLQSCLSQYYTKQPSSSAQDI